MNNYQVTSGLVLGTGGSLSVMAIEVTCDRCHKGFRLADHYAGKTVRCSGCQGPIPVPDGNDADDDYAVAEDEAPAAAVEGLVRGRSERAYVHRACGKETALDGPELSAVADPLARMVRTYCAECEEFFPMDEFAWSDTREPISAYYQRYQQQVSPLLRFLASRLGMFMIAGCLVWIGFSGSLVLGSVWVLGVGLILSLGSFAFHTVILGPWILRRSFGTGDARELP